MRPTFVISKNQVNLNHFLMTTSVKLAVLIKWFTDFSLGQYTTHYFIHLCNVFPSFSLKNIS